MPGLILDLLSPTYLSQISRVKIKFRVVLIFGKKKSEYDPIEFEVYVATMTIWFKQDIIYRVRMIITRNTSSSFYFAMKKTNCLNNQNAEMSYLFRIVLLKNN